MFSASTDESLQIMNDPQFDPRRLAILQGEGPAAPEEQSGGDAWIMSYEPEKIVIGAESELNSLLMLTDANYPGWKATIDGVSTSIYEADILFRGVFVPAGEHIVEFTFEPGSFSTGWMISLAGIALWILLAMAAFWPNQLPWDSDVQRG
jgi:hypothetical protein